MKIVVSRDTIGRGLGVLLLAAAVLLLSYLTTAFVWWQLNPGLWSAGARGTALGFALFLLIARWLAGVITIAAPATEEDR